MKIKTADQLVDYLLTIPNHNIIRAWLFTQEYDTNKTKRKIHILKYGNKEWIPCNSKLYNELLPFIIEHEVEGWEEIEIEYEIDIKQLFRIRKINSLLNE